MGTIRADNFQNAAGTRGFIGITDGANAATGMIGEFLISTLTADLLLSNQPVAATWYGSASWLLSVPAGDWDIHLSANINATGGGGGQGNIFCLGLRSTTTGNTGLVGSVVCGYFQTITTGIKNEGASLTLRWNTSSGATLYPSAKWEATGAAPVLSTLGFFIPNTSDNPLIWARRMR